MIAPCRVAVRAAVLVLLTTLAPTSPRSASAVPLPPGPVLGQPADYVIVTPAAFAREFQRLAKWKTKLGIPAIVKTLESIQTEYPSGRDAAERVRMFLQDAHTQWNTHWVLLGGVPPYVPARRVHMVDPIGPQDVVTDLYFAGLDGNWDADGDGIFGEGTVDNADLGADVFVGRAPVRSAAEAKDFVGKTLRASFEPYTPTAPRAVLTADVVLPSPWFPGDPIMADMAGFAEYFSGPVFSTPRIEVVRLYQNWSDPQWPTAEPLDRASLLASLRDGADFLAAVCRGGPMSMTAGNDSVTAADLGGLGDAVRPVHAWLTAACAGNFEGDCLAANFVRGESGGAATCVAAAGIGFFGILGGFYREFVIQAFPPAAKPVGEAHALSTVPFLSNAASDGPTRSGVLQLNLLGDPESHIRTSVPAPIAAQHPAGVAAGSSGFEVTVTTGGKPVAGARVCAILEPDALAIAITDAAGYARLDFAPAQAGEAQLTITAPGGACYEAQIPVSATLAVGEGGAGRLSLGVPEPNPALASVRLSGASPAAAALDLFDLGGRKLRSFALAAGRFDVRWNLTDENGRRVAPGLYFARLVSVTGSRVQRILVAR